MLLTAILALFLVAATTGSALADITGTASIIDGDTIEVHGQRIRFHGIDAPESRQTCIEGNRVWRCGQQAALALADFIGGAPVVCQEQGVDRYGRIIGVCSVRGEDIEEILSRLRNSIQDRELDIDDTLILGKHERFAVYHPHTAAGAAKPYLRLVNLLNVDLLDPFDENRDPVRAGIGGANMMTETQHHPLLRRLDDINPGDTPNG